MKHDEKWMSETMSKISTLQNKFIHEGMGKSDAFSLAADMIAEEQGVASGSELLSECGKISARMKHTKGAKQDPTAKNATIVDRYREWCDQYDFIPADYILAYWTGNDKSAFWKARKIAESEGFVYRRLSHNRGWQVKERPPEPEPKLEPGPIQGNLPNLDILMNLSDDKKQAFHKAMVALLEALGK